MTGWGFSFLIAYKTLKNLENKDFGPTIMTWAAAYISTFKLK